LFQLGADQFNNILKQQLHKMIVFQKKIEGTLLLQLLLEHGCWAAVMRANMAMPFFGKGINTSLSLSPCREGH
jgi:hypothetical protein